MINPKFFFNCLKKNNITFFSGVPDSLLKNFCSFVEASVPSSQHIIAANEGAAVSIGIGHYLATNNTPMIYMQNSGLGNSINPLISLADKKVYSIPMILLIGWRGEPGVPDEPQHVKQGSVMPDLLNVLEIPYEVITEKTKTAELEEIINTLSKRAKMDHQPVAIVASKNSFSKYNLSVLDDHSYSLSREEALEIVLPYFEPRDIVVSTTGVLSRELFELRDKYKQNHNKDFLTVGGMGHASQIALGIAIELKNRGVYCLDGDGSIIMHMGSLAISANSGARNLKHILFNNHAHDSVGGQPTIFKSINTQMLVESVGYKWIGTAKNKKQLNEYLVKLSKTDGPCFLEIKVKKGFREKLGRPTISPEKNKINFMSFLSYDE